MKRSLKAVLLSALVFPGLGHFLLKKPTQGVVLSGICALCLYSVMSGIMAVAQSVSVKIQRGDIPFDLKIISELIAQELSHGRGQSLSTASLLIVIIWVIAIADAYRIGRWQEKRAAESA